MPNHVPAPDDRTSPSPDVFRQVVELPILWLEAGAILRILGLPPTEQRELKRLAEQLQYWTEERKRSLRLTKKLGINFANVTATCDAQLDALAAELRSRFGIRFRRAKRQNSKEVSHAQ